MQSSSRSRSRSRFFTGFLAALHVLVSIVAVAPLSVWAQAIDSEPPVVKYEPVGEGVVGESQMFTATVTDNQGVSSVVLHFRLDDNSAYVAREMQLQSGTDIYTTIVDTNNTGTVVNSIQYFIEAKDNAGNRTLEGFAFDPIERLLLVQDTGFNEAANGTSNRGSIQSGGLSTSQKVLIGLLGIVVVGALASSSSSSNGGGNSEPGVDVTIRAEPVQ